MEKTVDVNGRKIEYILQYKNVKNINLRIEPNGNVCISANRRIPIKMIESFIISKADFITKAQNSFSEKQAIPLIRYYNVDEVKSVILELCRDVYPYFEKRGVKFPQIKFRRMVSQWGNCRSEKGILTFNTNLMYSPLECIEYVVCHEFTHFLVPNHSAEFYNELCKVFPNWKKCRNKLREIQLRRF